MKDSVSKQEINRYHNMSEEKNQELKECQKQRYQKAKEPKNNE